MSREKADRDALHEWMFERWTDRNGLLSVSQREIAEMLGMNYFSFAHIMGEFRDTGRIRRVGTKYQVVDPKIWRWDHRQDLLGK